MLKDGRVSFLAVAAIMLCFVAILGCKKTVEGPDERPIGTAGIANPASQHCVDNGGELVIRTAEDGGQAGYCTFSDGSECEEWAFFRGECSAGGDDGP